MVLNETESLVHSSLYMILNVEFMFLDMNVKEQKITENLAEEKFYYPSTTAIHVMNPKKYNRNPKLHLT